MQLRPILTALVVGGTLACVATFASAQHIYTWKDAHGVVHFSGLPPSPGTKYTEMHVQGQRSISAQPAAASSTPKPAKRGSQGDKAPASVPASARSAPDTPANRASLCKQLDSNIALLRSKRPVVQDLGGGKQSLLSDNAREQHLATSLAQQKQYCSKKS